jgi:hypothetical protein
MRNIDRQANIFDALHVDVRPVRASLMKAK